MFESFDWVRAMVTVAFGALAGGVTNRVAVWMLFHPYRPPKILGRPLGWFQGAIPKNQKRLASSVGQVVGGTLLTPEDITAELRDEELRTAFEERIRELITSLVEGDQPSLADLLPDAALVEVRALIEHLLAELYDQLGETLESPEFECEAERLLAELAESLADDPLTGTLDDERFAELRESLDGWLGRLVDSEAFDQTVRRHLRKAAEHVLQPGRTLEELIPAGLVDAVEHATRDYLPVAIDRLGRLLEDPEARARIERTIHGLLDRFMQDLKFHQRVVAKLIVTEDTVDKVLKTLETEGADEVAETLKEPEVQAAISRSVNDGIVEFLRRPTIRVLGEADSPQVSRALDSIAEWVVGASRDPAARRFLLEQLEDAVWRVSERSWGDVLKLLPARRLGVWIATALHSEPGRALYGKLGESLVERVLTEPIGRLNRFLRDDAAARLADALAPPAWDWVTEQVPEVARRIRISERIEDKIQEFPILELEALIRRVTQRELNLIIRLGYILGAMIGAILVGVNTILA